MSHRAASVLVLSVLMATAAHAQPASEEKALAIAAADPQLKWGPCPAFIPKGCEIAILHGDPAKANADVFFKVPGNFEIPPHWHTSAERMVLVSGELRVSYDGQPPATLKPGMYAFGPAKVPHSASCVGGDPCVLFIAFESAVDAHPVAAEKKER